ncbi:N-acetyltransferase [Streptomyces spiroverticillatus]|uniref:N-acetyltransferase n=1 Tax=Streptomyces finlayi TaxID=67296 RepID=A0A918WX10_9ACTN|nr:GNAT family N-acetyltransferase [Streptomyces finlayi]GHA09155.1 N-acetyltransferase [Streptomyces spiroverticillatus]GHC91913.1 N-acetyltransferase [Streptomyces finlayi]
MRREPRITPIGPADVARIVALHRRCTPQTLWSRYHRAMFDPGGCLPTLLNRPGSVHLAAQEVTGRHVAVGHLMPDHSAVEAALLVEDSSQGRGLGTRLLRRLARHALSGGWESLYGLFLAGDERIEAILRHADVTVNRTQDGDTVTARVRTRDLAKSG